MLTCPMLAPTPWALTEYIGTVVAAMALLVTNSHARGMSLRVIASFVVKKWAKRCAADARCKFARRGLHVPRPELARAAWVMPRTQSKAFAVWEGL